MPLHAPERADLIDGMIGEGSPLHSTSGHCARGVGLETAALCPGWRDRRVPSRNDALRGTTGWCLDPHDLVLPKLVAGRAKDLEFARAAAGAGMLDLEELERRLAALQVDVRLERAVAGRIERLGA